MTAVWARRPGAAIGPVDRAGPRGYSASMQRPVLFRLLREWAALLAVLAMALGPLALATSRSIGAAEKVMTAAAGLKPAALCLPGGDAGGPMGPECDHCTPPQPLAPASPATSATPAAYAADAADPPASGQLAAFPRAPPARGPPAS